MPFQVQPLAAEPFQPYYGLSDAELAAHGIVARIADASPGYPCRVSLVDAAPGERVLLLNHEHLAVASPFRGRHAIYVRDGARAARPAPGEWPAVLARRLLSLRAFDAHGMLLDADVIDGRDAAPVLESWLANAAVAHVDAHNAKPGCYAARIVRA